MTISDTTIEEIMMNVHIFMENIQQCENVDKILRFESSEIELKKIEHIDNNELFYTLYIENSTGNLITVYIYTDGFIYTFDCYTSEKQQVLADQVKEIYNLLNK